MPPGRCGEPAFTTRPYKCLTYHWMQIRLSRLLTEEIAGIGPQILGAIPIASPLC